ncbi:MAG: hypothetical protein H0T79_12015, partial [Deltaproteobacteria bacterium]|nr:hypothetical protein [Deltaproteobacteria bacterium]
ADFAMEGSTLDAAAGEAAGFVGPTAYVTGRIRLSGIAGNLIDDPETISWATLAGSPITGTAFPRSLDLDYGTDVPPGLGLSTGSSTILVEGEVYLDVAGNWGFELVANDRGFLELAAPGGDFTRVLTDANTGTAAPYAVRAPGWHRFRGAFANTEMVMAFAVRTDPPNLPGNFRDVSSENLRAGVDGLTGFVVDGFDGTFLLDYRSSTLVSDSLEEVPFVPDQFGLPIGVGWTLRLTGQVLIDVDGDYAFRIDAQHGHRAWLDGVAIADRFDDNDAPTVTPALHLEPGWHDLVIDAQRHANAGPAHLAVTVESGPTWAGAAIPVDHVRPVVGRGVRWTSRTSGAVFNVPDTGSVTGTLYLTPPADIRPVLADVGFTVEHPVLSSLSVVLDTSTGQNLTLAPPGSINGSGPHFGHAVVPGTNAGTAWGFIVSDGSLDLMTGQLTETLVTLSYAGGVAPVPPVYAYVSAPRELGDVVAWGALHWAARQTANGSVTVQFRSCDDAASCAAQPWTDVLEGETPTVPPRRFAQYQLAFTSDGDVPTALDWIELAYSARPES